MQHHSSPFGIAQEGLDQRWRLVVQEQVLRRIPISVRYARVTSKGPTTYQGRVANELASQPKEGLLKVVVRLRRNIIVLQIFLAMEGDSLRLDFALLDINLVASQNNWNVLTDTDQVT